MDSGAFDTVRRLARALESVEATTRYDGACVLKLGGCFMAGLATHRSAEPGTLVVRARFDERALMLQEAPDTYYVTEYYVKYPLVLVRLSRIDEAALTDLLTMSWRLTQEKLPGYARRRRGWS
jgi:hypothetical protein